MIKTLKDLNQAASGVGRMQRPKTLFPQAWRSALTVEALVARPAQFVMAKGLYPKARTLEQIKKAFRNTQTVAKELMSTGEKIKEIERRTGCTTEQAKQALAAVDSTRDFSTNPAEIQEGRGQIERRVCRRVLGRRGNRGKSLVATWHSQ